MKTWNNPFAKNVPILMADPNDPSSSGQGSQQQQQGSQQGQQQQQQAPTGPVQISLNHNKPVPYKGGKPKDWIESYDVIATANGWNADKKLQNIPPLFQDNAKGKNWYTLSYQNKPPTNYDDFKKKFTEELAPANYEYFKFQAMNDRHQGMTEHCVDYYLAKVNLINDHDDKMNVEMKINVVINGLREEVRKRVFGKAKDMNELFQLLKNEDFLRKDESVNPIFAMYPDNRPPPPYQGYYQSRGNYRQMYQGRQRYYAPNSNVYNNTNNLYRGPNRSRGTFQPRTNFTPRYNFYPRLENQRTDQQRPNAVCYCCHRPGHIAKNCRQAQRRNNDPNGTRTEQSTAPQDPKN